MFLFLIKVNYFIKISGFSPINGTLYLYVFVHASFTHKELSLFQVTDKEREEVGESIVVKTVPYSDTLLRFVLHCDISPQDVQRAINKFSYVLCELS